MAGEIEIVSDGDGVVVVGEETAVTQFLDHAGLTPNAKEFALGKLTTFLKYGAELAETASSIAEQSAFYLKLTPESAKRLHDAGGLMKTKTKGVSHAMLGDPGKVDRWLQVEDGPASFLTNPAVLSGVGGLMSQFAQQAEAQELKALLVKIDEKLDQVQRTQRDLVLAKMHRAAAAIEEAMTLRQHGGDPGTLWAKVSGESATILEVQNAALLGLGALADRVINQGKTRDLAKITNQVERDVAIQLSILARCFELQDEFRIVELDHVLSTAPEKLEGHRLGIDQARQKRREDVLDKTRRLMELMDAAGGIANANILLHARAARSVIDSLNETAVTLHAFHAPLGIASGRVTLSAIRWRDALQDPDQLKNAGREAGQKAAAVAGSLAAVALVNEARKKIPKSGA